MYVRKQINCHKTCLQPAFLVFVGGHYEVDIVQKEDFTFTIVPLTRERRQVHSNEKKPDEPNEAKAKTTKKPTSLDVKPSAPSFSGI